MTNIVSPSVQGRIKRIVRRTLRLRREEKKFEEVQREENKRIQKDNILDEEDEEEEDEYVDHYQKRNVKYKKNIS